MPVISGYAVQLSTSRVILLFFVVNPSSQVLVSSSESFVVSNYFSGDAFIDLKEREFLNLPVTKDFLFFVPVIFSQGV